MNNERIYKYIVIGAGASGLFFAANVDASVRANSSDMKCSSESFAGERATSLILEKIARPGVKLLMSGGGRCNITRAGPIKDFISHYGNGKQIRRVLYKHSNIELINWLAENGIKTIAEGDGRVFPASNEASDILDFLLKKSRENGFEIKTSSPVISIERCGELWRVHCAAAPAAHQQSISLQTAPKKQVSSPSHRNESSIATFLGQNIIIATGGCSYPGTGSDGSMFEILRRDLGLSITDLTPALSPVSVLDYPYTELSGVSLVASVTISEGSCRGEKTSGAVLFTHNSLSGPAIINISGSLSPGDKIKINYLHPMDYQDAFRRIQDALVGNKSQFATVVAETFNLPKSFSRIMASRSANSTKVLAHLLTEDEFTVKNAGSFANAMVTRGGIALDEIDLSTMQLNKHPGIFAIGEALDVDGETGGYNLQFAYSSALCAALISR